MPEIILFKLKKSLADSENNLERRGFARYWAAGPLNLRIKPKKEKRDGRFFFPLA
jgi:hypothetical protein